MNVLQALIHFLSIQELNHVGHKTRNGFEIKDGYVIQRHCINNIKILINQTDIIWPYQCFSLEIWLHQYVSIVIEFLLML